PGQAGGRARAARTPAATEPEPDHAQPAHRRPGGEDGGAPACRCAADHAGRDRRDTAPDRSRVAQATEQPLAAIGGGTAGSGGERRSLIPGTPLPRGSVLVRRLAQQLERLTQYRNGLRMASGLMQIRCSPSARSSGPTVHDPVGNNCGQEPAPEPHRARSSRKNEKRSTSFHSSDAEARPSRMISISALSASVAVKMPSRAPSSSLTMTLPTLRSDITKATSSRGVEAVTLSGFSAMISEACTWNFSAALRPANSRTSLSLTIPTTAPS